MRSIKKSAPLPNCFRDGNIRPIVTERKKRQKFEEFFLALSSPEDKENFLTKFTQLTGERGEWNFLSNKFRDDTLKKVSKQKHAELMKLHGLQSAIIEFVQKDEVIKKENFMQMIVGFLKNLTKKPTA